MYEVNITPENHGYTIRLVKRNFENIEGKGSVETSETISCLMIEYSEQHRRALLLRLYALCDMLSRREVKNLEFKKGRPLN